MLEVKKIVTPSAEEFQAVIHGMRNAFKSWDKSDSEFCWDSDEIDSPCDICPYVERWVGEGPYRTPVCGRDIYETDPIFILGKNDKRLLLNLTQLGTSDRKLLRQLPIILEITAPEYFFRQFDTYKVGTVANSTSQMHVLLKDKFTLEDFSVENLRQSVAGGMVIDNLIAEINSFREAYFHAKFEGEKEIIWNQILELIPQSFNYTRTVSLNYEVALTMIHQRKNHPLEEWKTLIDYLLRNVPYLEDIYKASCAKEDKLKTLEQENKTLMQEIKKLKDRLKEKQ